MNASTPRDARTIRAARPDEARQLSEIAFRSKAHWSYSDAFMESCRDELSVSAHDIATEPAFLAELAGRVIGFYTLARLSRSRVEVGHLFVEPAEIRTGCGRTLFEHAVARASDAGYAILVIQSDPHAEAFYAACGAVRVGEEPSTSSPGRELPLMEIELTAPVPDPHLATPRVGLREPFVEMARETLDDGDPRYAAALENFEGYLAVGRRFATDAGLAADRVPMDEFWLVDRDRVLGGSRLRHELNPATERDGGHIGYDIRPSARRLGHGHRILALTLDRARAIGLDRVLLTCETTNAGSAKIIERAGGSPISNATSTRTGREMLRYWIALTG